MSLIGTLGSYNLVSLPSTVVAGCPPISSIEWNPQEMVGATTGITTGQQQVFDWQGSYWEGTLRFPPMNRANADLWSSFVLQCRGQVNAFSIGDPRAKTPKGSGLGTPVIAGSGQSGYFLNTRGWVNNDTPLKSGDNIQIGYRMYKVLNDVVASATGTATLAIWPNLRTTTNDTTTDGTTIYTSNCTGLFRLKANQGNKYSVGVGTVGGYGMSGLAIREAI